MRWMRNIAQTLHRIWTERRGAVLLGAAAVFLVAAAVVLGLVLDGQQGEPAKVAKQTPAETEAAAPPPKDKGEGGGSLPPTDAEETAEKPYEWGDPHPWLVDVGEYFRAYIGPQTPEAIMAVFYPWMAADRERWGETEAEYSEIIRRVLERGGFVHDLWYLGQYDAGTLQELKSARTWDQRWTEFRAKRGDSRPITTIRAFWGLPESASWEELENKIIDARIKEAITIRDDRDWSDKTGEVTLRVTLDPDNSSIGYSSGGRPSNKRKLTDTELYNISRYGIAPKGHRLLFMDESGKELAPDAVPFFNEKKYVKNLNKAQLEDLLKAIPAYLNSADALEQSDVIWFSMVDRYDAALQELAKRGQVPDPFPSAPKPQTSASGGGPPLPSQGSSDVSPLPLAPNVVSAAKDAEEEAARHEAVSAAERQKRVALAFLEALEKSAKEIEIAPAERVLISRRLRELRLMLDPSLLKPDPPPPPEDLQDEGE